MQIIKLPYDKLVNIISENVQKFLLKERISPLVWHFTYLDALISILSHNRFRLQRSYPNHYEYPGITGYSQKHPYYLCTTRSKSSYDGYSRTLLDDNEDCYVRLTLDGDKLNNVVHGKASDYFGSSKESDYWSDSLSKRTIYTSIRDEEPRLNGFNSIEDWYRQSEDVKSNEKEDTLWYNKEYLNNANRYITRIDVMICTKGFYLKNENSFKLVKELAEKLNIPIYFYLEQSDFENQKGEGIL